MKPEYFLYGLMVGYFLRVVIEHGILFVFMARRGYLDRAKKKLKMKLFDDLRKSIAG